MTNTLKAHETIKYNIELLMNLAQADGQLHPAELAFILALMIACKVNTSQFQDFGKQDNSTIIYKINNKSEFIYLALKLIQVDKHVALSELSFCRNIAFQLGFKPALVDHFAESALDNPGKFKKELNKWLI